MLADGTDEDTSTKVNGVLKTTKVELQIELTQPLYAGDVV